MGGLHSTCVVSLLLQARSELPPAGLGFGVALLKMVAALVLVCVLAYLALRLARRYLVGTRGEAGLLRVVERCPLSARQSLWVVEVGRRYFLLGASDGVIAKLAELDPEEVRAVTRSSTGHPVGRSFRDLLKRRGPPEGRA